MNHNQDNTQPLNHVVDMLLDSTLKKHGVKIEETTINNEEKAALNEMANNLKQTVQELNTEQQTTQEE